MTTEDVIKKLALEIAIETGHYEWIQLYQRKIGMALTIGLENDDLKQEVITALTKEGEEVGSYISREEASRSLGVNSSSITNVLNSRRMTAGGYLFVKKTILKLKKKRRDHHKKICSKCQSEF